MSGKKDLFKNTAIFAISNFSSKLLVFLMLPLYTSVLSTDEYGRADLVIAVTTFLLPLLTLSIADATLRFGMDKRISPQRVFSQSFGVCTVGVILLTIITPVIDQFLFFEVNIVFVLLIGYFSFFAGMFSMMARAIDKVSIVGIAGVVSTLVTVLSNILLLVVFKVGLNGYLISTVLTHLSSCIVLFFGCKLYRFISISEITHPDKAIFKEMILYSIPLIPKNTCWWLIDTANKYILGLKDSTQAVGIYSAATKIPTILTTLQGFFSQAWILSAIDASESSNKVHYYSQYYAFYSTFLFCLSSGLMFVCQVLGQILYSKEFIAASDIVPILIISTFFGGLIGFTSSIFSAIKRTKTVLISTSIGAVTSIILDFLLIPSLGACGAAISNATAYFLIWIIGMILLYRHIKLIVDWKKFISRTLVIVFQAISFFIIKDTLFFYIIQIVCGLLIVVLSFSELKYIVGSLISSLNARKKRK